jgi:uncharacterized membrane protein YhaH (DUF805 family)
MHLETQPPFAGPDTATAAPHFFSLSDRVGRVRYFTYILGALTACGLLLILIYIAAYLLPAGLGKLVSVTSYIMIKSVVFPLIVFVMSIRRLHDFDLSGWWSLLALIPVVPIALVFIPGQEGSQSFRSRAGTQSDRTESRRGDPALRAGGLYYYMLEINPKARTGQTPAAGSKPALRSYDAK